MRLKLVSLIRSLRNNVVLDGITINDVAPAGTHTPLVAGQLDSLVATRLPIASPAEPPTLALIYSATAVQDRHVEAYGKEKKADMYKKEGWNGHVIYLLSDEFTEIEEPTVGLPPYGTGLEDEMTNWSKCNRRRQICPKGSIHRACR